MFARWLILVSWLLAIGFTLNGQDVVKGRVSDGETGETLPGVHVLIAGSSIGTLTDPEGSYILRVSSTPVKLVFRFVGYGTREFQVRSAATDTVTMDVVLYSEVTSINEIVVTAGKGRQRISDLSVSMSLLKPYQVSRSHILSADELLQRTTGVEVTDGQASIRGGSGYSYGAGSRVLTLIDGLPALSADAGNIKWGTLPIENISRVEVIKGASSVLYGSSALNGVVNFITRENGPDPVTRISLTAGIYGNPAREEWKWWSSPRMSQNISFTHASAAGRTEYNAGGRFLNDNGYRKHNYETNGRLNLGVRHHSSRIEGFTFGSALLASASSKNDFLLWTDASTGALIQSPSTEMDYRGLTIAFDPYIGYDPGGKVNHSVKTRWMTNLNMLPENSNNNSNSHSFFSEYQSGWRVSEKISMVSGLLFQASIVTSEFYGNHRGYNAAVYSQADVDISKRLKGVGGVRIEQFSLDGNNEVPVPLFRAGINAELSAKTFLRASFGQGYRYPSVAEKHAYTTVGSIRIFPNDEIKPEYGWSSEIGLRRSVTGSKVSGSADMAIFYSRNFDMIEYVFGSYRDPFTNQFEPGFRPVNIENSEVYGTEAEVSLNWPVGPASVGLTGGYTFIYPVEINNLTLQRTGDWLKYRRKHSANLSMNMQWRRFDAGFTLNYRSSLLAIDNVFTNEFTREQILPGFYDYWLENNMGYVVADINASWRFNNGIAISAVVKNLTNTEYMGRPGDIQPQRYFSLGVSMTL